MVRKLVIPSAGFGTRFLPLTKAIPKEMVPIVDKPSIYYIVDEGRRSDIDTFVIVVSRGKVPIEDYFDRNPELEEFLKKKGKKDLLEKVLDPPSMGSFVFVRQDFPKGLGHAVLCAEAAVGNETFAVSLPDDLIISDKPCILQLLEAMERYGADGAIALQEVPEKDVSRYGVVSGKRLSDSVIELDGLVEKPPVGEAPSNLAIVGRYVLPPSIFGALKKTPKGRGGEIQLTDAISRVLGSSKIIGVLFEGKRFDVGTPEGFLKANIEVSRIMGM